MFNLLARAIFNKDIILYHRHRNSLPLLNEVNKKKFFFIHCPFIWKCTGIFGRKSRLRSQIMSLILSFIRPLYIVDINWIGRLGGLYLVWCRNHRPSQFVVVQHGLYIGGVITDNAHKYVKCDILLSWGKHSLQEFQRYNSQKRVNLVLWGNPFYNQYDRNGLSFSKICGNKVLVAPSVIKGERKQVLEDFMTRLDHLGFEVFVKEHNFQTKLSESLQGFPKAQNSLYEILLTQEFDIIVSDISTSLVDSLYFKNRTIFFSPEGELPEYTHNVYAKYMWNVSTMYQSFQSKDDFLDCVDLEAQEALLADLVTIGTNDLSILTEQ